MIRKKQVKCFDYVPSYEQFQTSRVLQHYQDSPLGIPSGLAASDRRPLRPAAEEHFDVCLLARNTTQPASPTEMCIIPNCMSHLLPCPHVNDFDLFAARQGFICPPPPLPLAPVHKKLEKRDK